MVPQSPSSLRAATYKPEAFTWERATAELDRAVALVEAGLIKEAEPLARAAADRLLESVGANHPDYASALITTSRNSAGSRVRGAAV